MDRSARFIFSTMPRFSLSWLISSESELIWNSQAFAFCQYGLNASERRSNVFGWFDNRFTLIKSTLHFLTFEEIELLFLVEQNSLLIWGISCSISWFEQVILSLEVTLLVGVCAGNLSFSKLDTQYCNKMFLWLLSIKKSVLDN